MAGKRGNPKGKPKGTPNKLSLGVKSRIVSYVENHFDSYIETLEALEPKDRSKAFTELIKLVVPRPVSKEELDAIKGSNSALVAKLFSNDIP